VDNRLTMPVQEKCGGSANTMDAQRIRIIAMVAALLISVALLVL
jgi:hypothetical protein